MVGQLSSPVAFAGSSPCLRLLRSSSSSVLASSASPHPSSFLNRPQLARRARLSVVPRHAPTIRSCASAGDVPGVDADMSADDDLKDLETASLPWSEIPFASLDAELAAIDDYVIEEELEADNSWPIYLRGAAYESWGRPSLASAQYELVRRSKGLRLVPELWCRKAYNAFKSGDVGVAERFHEIAALIRAEAVGNQMHFSFWFEKTFADFRPRRNGPPYPLQNAIYKYCTGKHREAYETVRPNIIASNGTSREMAQASLWLLAISARMNSTIAVDASGLPEMDVKMAMLGFDASDGAFDEDLAPIVKLFLNPDSQTIDEVERTVSSDGEHEIIRASYMALFYDSFARDEEKRDGWLDTIAGLRAPDCTNDDIDFMFWAAKNRFQAPAEPELPALQVPM